MGVIVEVVDTLDIREAWDVVRLGWYEDGEGERYFDPNAEGEEDGGGGVGGVIRLDRVTDVFDRRSLFFISSFPSSSILFLDEV
jgi:hypothetical protein